MNIVLKLLTVTPWLVRFYFIEIPGNAGQPLAIGQQVKDQQNHPLLLDQSNKTSWVFTALKSTSLFLPQCIVSCPPSTSSEANSIYWYRSDAWLHLEERVTGFPTGVENMRGLSYKIWWGRLSQYTGEHGEA